MCDRTQERYNNAPTCVLNELNFCEHVMGMDEDKPRRSMTLVGLIALTVVLLLLGAAITGYVLLLPAPLTAIEEPF